MSAASPLLSLALLLPTLTALAAQPALPTARIDAVFKAYGNTTPGCALGIYHQGKVVYAKGYGMADLNLNVPITPGTMFDIGSTSKQFAAAATLLLVLDGKLALGDDVRRYIPELPDYGHTITVDHLLRHTSGLRDYNELLYTAGHYYEDVTSDADALQIISAQQGLNFIPGSQWEYSNTGYFLLSLIVQRTSGLTLAEFSQARLFAPLGMTRTHFRNDHTAIVPGRATAYADDDHGHWRIDMSNWDQTGDGALQSNVLELARWDANFYSGKVGGPTLLGHLQAPGKLDNGQPHHYGRGVFLDHYRGLQRVQHDGAWAGYRAMLMRFPDPQLSIGLLCNAASADTESLAESVADLILASSFKQPRPAGVDTSARFDAQPYLGTYYALGAQMVIRVVEQDGKPMLDVFGSTRPLSAGKTDGHLTTGRLELAFSPDRRSATLSELGDQIGSFVRAPAPPTQTDLTEFAGGYYSRELGSRWTVRVKDGKVYIKGKVVGERELQPALADGYTADGALYLFLRDAEGRIQGMNYSAYGMKGIRFSR
ncbi:serine hydrolase domain-containing protein [Chitinimonas naiadis]